MKFVADVMLGRLARLMRFAGYDVEYDSGADDDSLLKKSRYRILLTRDRPLVRRVKPGRVYFVRNVGALTQLSEVESVFPPPKTGPRCLECNLKIRRIAKAKVEHLTPPYVFRKYTRFFVCPGCRRLYWEGTHFDHMMRMIK